MTEDSAVALTVSRRRSLRQRLLAERAAFAASAEAAVATALLARALGDVLAEIEPECLGLYCALGSEFNAASALAADARLAKTPWALPYARRTPRSMTFRRWRHGEATSPDECGIGSSTNAEVEPDVVIVPCVGYTAAGHRLGFGGGYYDRWLALHPQVTAVGVAWSFAEIDLDAFAAQPHDIPLAFVVTERGAR